MSGTTEKNLIACVNERSLTVTPAEAASFPYDAIDVLITQNLLAGVTTSHGLAGVMDGVTEIAVRNRLLDPVRCAWMSQQLSAAVGQRLGLVLASVYGRALATGDPRAAELLFKRYGEMAPVKSETVHHIVDYSKLPAGVLEKMISEKMRILGIEKETLEAETDDDQKR